MSFLKENISNIVTPRRNDFSLSLTKKVRFQKTKWLPIILQGQILTKSELLSDLQQAIFFPSKLQSMSCRPSSHSLLSTYAISLNIAFVLFMLMLLLFFFCCTQHILLALRQPNCLAKKMSHFSCCDCVAYVCVCVCVFVCAYEHVYVCLYLRP